MQPTNLTPAQEQLIQRAQEGLIKHIAENGGSVGLAELHSYSERTFFIGHQRFSQMLETLVASEKVEVDMNSGRVSVLPKPVVDTP